MAVIPCHECKSPFFRKGGGHIRCLPCARSNALVQGAASRAVRRAVIAGQLPNLRATYTKCADCDARADRYDHRDYAKPLDVEAVCQRCNRRRPPAINAVVLARDFLRPASEEKCEPNGEGA